MNNTEKITLYLENVLSEPEKVSFERELAENAELKVLYEVEKRLHHKLLQVGREETYKGDAEEWRKRQLNEKEIFSPLWIKTSKLAAIFIFAVGVSIWYFYPTQNTAIPTEQALAYFEAYHPDKLMGGVKTEDAFLNGARLYENGDFEGAIKAFEAITEKEHARYIESQLLMGNAYFQLKNYAQAITFLALIPENSLYRDKANFDMALAYIAQNERNTAKKYLEKVRNKGERGKNAKDLLGKLGEEINE